MSYNLNTAWPQLALGIAAAFEMVPAKVVLTQEVLYGYLNIKGHSIGLDTRPPGFYTTSRGVRLKKGFVEIAIVDLNQKRRLPQRLELWLDQSRFTMRQWSIFPCFYEPILGRVARGCFCLGFPPHSIEVEMGYSFNAHETLELHLEFQARLAQLKQCVAPLTP